MEPRFVHEPLVAPRAIALSGAMLPLLLGHFLLFGLLVGGTGVLWAEVFAALGFSKGIFGSTQLVAALVSVALLIVGGRLSARLGKKWLALGGLALLSVAMVLLAMIGSFWSYLGVLMVWGFGQACLDLAMNGATLDWERVSGRTVMSVMHACFSGGAMVGAFGAGALLGIGWNYVQVLWLLACVTALFFVLTLLVRYPLAGAPDEDTGLGGTVRLLFSQRLVLILSLIGLFSILAESAVNIWAVIYLHSLGAEAVVGGLAFGLFNAAMLLGRILNAPLVARYGGRISLLISGAAMVLAALLLLPGGVTLTISAFVVLGLAVAGVIPTVMSAAARVLPANSGTVASALMAAAYMGFIISPPITGWLAELVSLRAALVVVALTGLPLLWFARRLR